MLPNINTYISICLAHTAERIQGTVGGHLLTHTAIIMEQSNSQKEQERERGEGKIGADSATQEVCLDSVQCRVQYQSYA